MPQATEFVYDESKAPWEQAWPEGYKIEPGQVFTHRRPATEFAYDETRMPHEQAWPEGQGPVEGQQYIYRPKGSAGPSAFRMTRTAEGKLVPIELAPWETEAPVGKVEDAVRGAGAGLVRGTADIPGAPGNVIELSNRIRDWLHDKSDAKLEEWGLIPKGTGALYDKSGMKGSTSPLPTGQDILNATGVEDKLYKPQTGWGKAAENVAAFIPGAVAPGAITGNLRRAGVDALRMGTVPGLLSEGAGEIADKVDPSYGPAARFAGGLLGVKAGNRVISPLLNPAPEATAAERANAVAALREEGVSPHLGQETGRKNASFLVEEVSPEVSATQREQFTRAAMRRVDIDGLATTGEGSNVARMMDDAGHRFERAIRNSGPMQVDRQLYGDLFGELNEVRQPGLYEEPVRNAVEGAITRISRASQTGAIEPRDYQTIRSSLSQQARETSDPRLSRRIYAVMGALDNQMERHLANIGENPQAFRDANDFYRRALVIRDAATRSGANAAIGHITPNNLASAAESVYGEQSRATGANPFSELAKNGQIALGEMNSSGTSERQHVRDLLKVPGNLLGAGLGYGADTALSGGEGLRGLWLGNALAPVIDPLVRVGLRNTVLSPAMQRILGNQISRHASDWNDIPGLLGIAQSSKQAGQQ